MLPGQVGLATGQVGGLAAQVGECQGEWQIGECQVAECRVDAWVVQIDMLASTQTGALLTKVYA